MFIVLSKVETFIALIAPVILLLIPSTSNPELSSPNTEPVIVPVNEPVIVPTTLPTTSPTTPPVCDPLVSPVRFPVSVVAVTVEVSTGPTIFQLIASTNSVESSP